MLVVALVAAGRGGRRPAGRRGRRRPDAAGGGGGRRSPAGPTGAPPTASSPGCSTTWCSTRPFGLSALVYARGRLRRRPVRRRAVPAHRWWPLGVAAVGGALGDSFYTSARPPDRRSPTRRRPAGHRRSWWRRGTRLLVLPAVRVMRWVHRRTEPDRLEVRAAVSDRVPGTGRAVTATCPGCGCRCSASWRWRCSRRCSPGSTTSRWSARPTTRCRPRPTGCAPCRSPAPRGRILDRNGKVLVDNRIAVVVAIDRGEFDELAERPGRRCSTRLIGELTAAGQPISPEQIAPAAQRPALQPLRPGAGGHRRARGAQDLPGGARRRVPGGGGRAHRGARLPLRPAGGPRRSATSARSTRTSWRRPGDRRPPSRTRSTTTSGRPASSGPTSRTCGARRACAASRSTPRATRCGSSASSSRGRATTSC